MTLAKTAALPHPFGVQEQSVPRPAPLCEASQDLQAPQASRLKTTYNLIVSGLCGQDPGAKVTAAPSRATYLPGTLKITFTRLGSEVSLGPRQPARWPYLIGLTPFVGALGATRPIYIGKWGLRPQLSAVPRQLVALSLCKDPTARWLKCLYVCRCVGVKRNSPGPSSSQVLLPGPVGNASV